MRRVITLMVLSAMLCTLFIGIPAYAENNPLDIYIPEETAATAPTTKSSTAQTAPGEDGEYEDWDSTTENGALAEGTKFTDDDLYLAAQLIYAEGKKQSDKSFEAMACVVYNRVMSKKFPSTVEKVVFQKNQFTVVNDREEFLALKPSKAARAAVYKVFVEGERPLPAEVMFFKSARLSQKWGKRVYYDTIGNNMYYS